MQASKPINVTFALTSITPRMIVPKNVTIQKLCLFKLMNLLAPHVQLPKNLPEENVKNVETTKLKLQTDLIACVQKTPFSKFRNHVDQQMFASQDMSPKENV